LDPVETDDVRRIAAMIERHYEEHPAAADTVEGVWRYWLPPAAGASRDLVERALELLMRRGSVGRRSLPDGGVIYVLASPVRGPRDG